MEEFVCICGKEFKSVYSLAAHHKYCQRYRDEKGMGVAPKPYENLDGINPGYGWNKGLTKETDERVAKGSNTLRKGYEEGRIVASNLGFRSHNKILNGGYIAYHIPEHPLARSNGLVFEHTLVAEGTLGRHLTEIEVVHHKDKNKLNNDPSNLMVFTTTADHTRYHFGKNTKLIQLVDGTWKCESI